jgi:hypothetical protein
MEKGLKMITTTATKDVSKFAAVRRATALRAALGAAALAGVFCSATPALADDGGHGALRLVRSIPFPSSAPALHGFDISWVDAATHRYYLADRSGAAIDVIDTASGTFLTPITVSPPFAGVKFNPATGAANNAISGPNGVTAAGRWLFATDAGSRVVSIDLTTNKLVSDLKTDDISNPNRADEMAYDPVGGNLLVINNADNPPFGRLFKVDTATGKMTKGVKILLNTAGGVNATNGAEQPVWDARTGKFYLSIPEIDCSTPACAPGSGPVGAVVSISPASTGKVDAVFKVEHCQPAGLTLGPRGDLLIGCGVVFDTAGKVWSAAGTTTAAPLSIVVNPKDGIPHQVLGVSGSDEVWYNAGDGNYYLAARNAAGGPVLGVVNARSKTLSQLVPTINVAGTPNKFPAGTAHSVAVNRRTNEVFVPLAANNVFPNCLNGCVAVYAAPGGRDD